MPSFRRVLFTAALCAAGAVQADTFTYSGRLDEHGAPADGRYDLKLSVHANTGQGYALVKPFEFEGVDVIEGDFRVEFDLPSGYDDAEVELAIRPDGSAGWVALPGRTKAVNTPAAVGQCWSSTGDSGSNPAINFLGTTDAQPLVLRTQNVRSLRIEPSTLTTGAPAAPVTSNLLGGSVANAITAGVRGATLAGGGTPAGDVDPDVLFEGPNRITDHYGTVGGGFNNRAGDDVGSLVDAVGATVAGGTGNAASRLATVGGGGSNRALGNLSLVAGGGSNTASAAQASVVGGLANTASADFATVGGGNQNCAGARYSWAGGRRAKVRSGSTSGDPGLGCNNVLPVGTDGDVGSFVWADSQAVDFLSSGPNQFNIRAQGGVGINTPPRDANVELTVRGRVGDAFGGNADVELIVDNANQEGIQFGAFDGGPGTNDATFEIAQRNPSTYTPRMTLSGSGAVTILSNTTGANTGVSLAANAGSWSSLSDRSLKMAIVPVDTDAVLARVLDLPMSTWSYIAQGEAIRHMGPMAQDFAAAFGLGENDTTISTVDADGVALAAIQGLNAKLEAQNARLSAQNEALMARLEALEAALSGREGR